MVGATTGAVTGGVGGAAVGTVAGAVGEHRHAFCCAILGFVRSSCTSDSLLWPPEGCFRTEVSLFCTDFSCSQGGAAMGVVRTAAGTVGGAVGGLVTGGVSGMVIGAGTGELFLMFCSNFALHFHRYLSTAVHPFVTAYTAFISILRCGRRHRLHCGWNGCRRHHWVRHRCCRGWRHWSCCGRCLGGCAGWKMGCGPWQDFERRDSFFLATFASYPEGEWQAGFSLYLWTTTHFPE